MRQIMKQEKPFSRALYGLHREIAGTVMWNGKILSVKERLKLYLTSVGYLPSKYKIDCVINNMV